MVKMEFNVKPRIKLAEARTPDGSIMELIQHDRDFLLVVNREVLMSTRIRNSEEEMARLGIEHLTSAHRVLIGGLGMGFTLRAALDCLSPQACVEQVELMPEIVEWNRGPLGEKTLWPLKDERVQVIGGDVLHVIRRSTHKYDSILLDVDNGPSAMVTKRNQDLYSLDGLAACASALKPDGRLVVWSANEDRAFMSRMRSVGFDTSMKPVKGTKGRGGPRHFLLLGIRI